MVGICGIRAGAPSRSEGFTVQRSRLRIYKSCTRVVHQVVLACELRRFGISRNLHGRKLGPEPESAFGRGLRAGNEAFHGSKFSAAFHGA